MRRFAEALFMSLKMIALAAFFATATACAGFAATAENDNAGASRMSSAPMGQNNAGAASSTSQTSSNEVGHGRSVGPASPNPNAGVKPGYAEAAGKGSGPKTHR